jgi:hypothetical protein
MSPYLPPLYTVKSRITPLWLLFGRLSLGRKGRGTRKLETLEIGTRWSGPRLGCGLSYLSRKRSEAA